MKSECTEKECKQIFCLETIRILSGCHPKTGQRSRFRIHSITESTKSLDQHETDPNRSNEQYFSALTFQKPSFFISTRNVKLSWEFI